MEMDSTAAARYSRGAMAFHWIIAVLIILNFLGGSAAAGLPAAEKMQALAGHKALGITILVLTVLRILWRIARPAPVPLLETLKTWEAALAKVVHALFYILLVAIPLAGWGLHSAATGGDAVSIFGLFDFPGLPLAKDKATIGIFLELHELFTKLMFFLLILHVAGALKHMFIDRDGTMRRMLPWGK